jgi:transcriptional regulator with XRE-family HTH domain
MNRLREIRVVKRITQFQLRLSTGIHQSKISMIENGLIEPREDEKQKLAKALHVRSEEIWVTDRKEEKKYNS